MGFPAIGLCLILFLMAATSHDFWLVVCTPRVWKGLHMAVYAAYALLVGHVGLVDHAQKEEVVVAVE